jgi:hypothetical protein
MKDLSATLPEASIASWHMPRLPQIRIPRFGLHTPSSPERAVVEAYIHDRFAGVHHAEVTHFLPNLISLRCASEYSAAVGLAPAGNGKVFAEQYLNAPVEQVISEKLSMQVARDQIIEVGNLVSTWKGSSLLLFIVIGEVMERLGYNYVMFTGTREVKALLARLRYSPIVLAEADPARLPDGGASWGSYYTNNPQVMFGDNRPAMAAARKNPMYRATVAAISRPIEKICAQLRAANQLTALDTAHSTELNDE